MSSSEKIKVGGRLSDSGAALLAGVGTYADPSTAIIHHDMDMGWKEIWRYHLGTALGVVIFSALATGTLWHFDQPYEQTAAGAAGYLGTGLALGVGTVAAFVGTLIRAMHEFSNRPPIRVD